MVHFDHVPIGTTEIVSSTVAIFFGCVFVGLRIWGRRIKKKCVDLSDYVAIGALVSSAKNKCLSYGTVVLRDEYRPP